MSAQEVEFEYDLSSMPTVQCTGSVVQVRQGPLDIDFKFGYDWLVSVLWFSTRLRSGPTLIVQEFLQGSLGKVPSRAGGTDAFIKGLLD